MKRVRRGTPQLPEVRFGLTVRAGCPGRTCCLPGSSASAVIRLGLAETQPQGEYCGPSQLCRQGRSDGRSVEVYFANGKRRAFTVGCRRGAAPLFTGLFD